MSRNISRVFYAALLLTTALPARAQTPPAATTPLSGSEAIQCTQGGNLRNCTAAAISIGAGAQTANKVLAGPSSGSAAAPTYRSLVTADLPAGAGTVTSVAGTGTVSGVTLTGTVTSTGNLTLGGTLAVLPSNFASQAANTVLAAPNGSSGAPTFRTLVTADVPTGTSGVSIPLLSGANMWGAPQDILNVPVNTVTGGQWTGTFLASIAGLYVNNNSGGVPIVGDSYQDGLHGYNFPSGIVGHGLLNAAGYQVYAANLITDCLTAGICGNEFDSNQWAGNAPTTYPGNYTSPVSGYYGQGLALNAGGNFTSYVGLIEGINTGIGTGASWNTGIYQVPGAINQYGILQDATATLSPIYSLYSKNNGQGGNINIVLQTMGTAVPNNSVISYEDASAGQHFAVKQSGAVYTTAELTAFGSAPTLSGTCSTGTQVGGQAAGSFKYSAACASGTVVMTFATAAPNGRTCAVQDMTTPTNILSQAAYTTTTATIMGTAVSGDQAVFACQGF